MLLLGLLGVAASAGAKSFAHSITFGITLAVLSNIAQFTAWSAKTRKGGGHWGKWGPTYLVSASVPLVMADLTRHVLQDADLWPAPGSAMYSPSCGHADIRCLSIVGWFFTIICTYSGFACLVLGTLWSANLHKKVGKAWRAARHGML